MTTTHEFDAYCNTVALEDPPYHEQLLMMQELEECRESALKEHGAIDALEGLRNRLVFFRDEYEKYYQNDASVSNYSAMLAHQMSVRILDEEVETHKRWLKRARGGVL